MRLDPYRFWALDAALDNASDRESSEAIRRVLQTWADANWAELDGRVRATALKRFEEAQYRFQRDFHAAGGSLRALERAEWPYKIVSTSASIAGQQAAVLAGIAVTVGTAIGLAGPVERASSAMPSRQPFASSA
jgi:hypothetical protein